MSDFIDADRHLQQTLLQMGLISQQQLTEALEFQIRLPQSQAMSLEAILVDMEFVLPVDIQRAKQAYAAPPAAPQAPDWVSMLAEEPSPEPQSTLSHTDWMRQFEDFDPEAPHSSASPAPVPTPMPVAATPAAHTEVPADIRALFEEPASTPQTEVPQEIRNLFEEPVTPAPPQETEPVGTARSTQPPAPPAVLRPSPPPVPAPHSTPPAEPTASNFNGWTVQSAWGAPKTPQQAVPAPPPPPPPPSAEDLKRMMAKVMGPNAPEPKTENKPLGEILVEKDELEEWQLMHALCLQKTDMTTKQQLGSILVKLGYVDQEAIEQALNVQIDD